MCTWGESKILLCITILSSPGTNLVFAAHSCSSPPHTHTHVCCVIYIFLWFAARVRIRYIRFGEFRSLVGLYTYVFKFILLYLLIYDKSIIDTPMCVYTQGEEISVVLCTHIICILARCETHLYLHR